MYHESTAVDVDDVGDLCCEHLAGDLCDLFPLESAYKWNSVSQLVISLNRLYSMTITSSVQSGNVIRVKLSSKLCLRLISGLLEPNCMRMSSESIHLLFNNYDAVHSPTNLKQKNSTYKHVAYQYHSCRQFPASMSTMR